MSDFLFDFKYSIYKKGRIAYMNQMMKKVLENLDKIDKIYFMEQKGINKKKILKEFPYDIDPLVKYKMIKKIVMKWLDDLESKQLPNETLKTNNLQSLFID
jgi:hypothetical protein